MVFGSQKSRRKSRRGCEMGKKCGGMKLKIIRVTKTGTLICKEVKK